MCLMLLFILLFSIYAWVYLFDVFCRILSLFAQHLTVDRCILASSTDTHELLRLWSKNRAESRFQHRPRSDCGEHETVASSSSFGCVAEINRAPL